MPTRTSMSQRCRSGYQVVAQSEIINVRRKAKRSTRKAQWAQNFLGDWFQREYFQSPPTCQSPFEKNAAEAKSGEWERGRTCGELMEREPRRTIRHKLRNWRSAQALRLLKRVHISNWNKSQEMLVKTLRMIKCQQWRLRTHAPCIHCDMCGAATWR